MRFISTLLVIFNLSPSYSAARGASFHNSPPIRIGIIDTGVSSSQLETLPFCINPKELNKSILDEESHGSLVTELIVSNLDKKDYCLIVFKSLSSKSQDAPPYLKALKYFSENKVDILNISAGGKEFIPLEEAYINQILNKKTLVVAAAGNERSNLDNLCNFFPACLSRRILTIGNGSSEMMKHQSSNYGNVVRFWRDGTFKEKTGTSFAAPRFANEVAKMLIKNK